MCKPTKLSWIAFMVLGLVALACLDPYNPPTTNEKTDFLVVDGSINSTDSLVTVMLGRAINLSSTAEYPAETNATVMIEDSNNQTALLPEIEAGVYSLKHTFDDNLQYRLKITARGSEYASDFISLEKNSPMDSVSWKADGTELEIYANTHDFSEGHKYYRYTIEETYEYTSIFSSRYKLVNGQAVFRTPQEDIYHCWLTQAPPTLTVTSTENLSQNIIANFPIHTIQKGDRRLWRNYSLLVRQIALSKEAFNHWNQIRTLTESLGGLFDPIPYQITGNIRSVTNSNEIVLGYFNGGAVSEKRLIIRSKELPSEYQNSPESDCTEELMPIENLASLEGKNFFLTRALMVGPSVVGYFYAIPDCTDCSLQGGTTEKPDFMN
jgi:hypothetical protein